MSIHFLRIRFTASLLLFGLSLFGSAALLFWIEPMFAKMILPKLGGSPSVWNVCLAFYQLVLLAGYIYAHLATRWLGMRQQVILHIGLLSQVLITLPIGGSHLWTPPAAANPIPWLLFLLFGSVGLPFFVISTTAPMLQKWFGMTGHPAAKDPYFLYSASNLGSMVALLGYPFLVEPRWSLAEQSKSWALGYLILAGLISTCAVMVWRSSGSRRVHLDSGATPQTEGTPSGSESAGRLRMTQRMRWVLLAFAPSSLLLGVTNYISTDISAVPLLWIIPLAIYLITFILVFAPLPLLPHRVMLRAQLYLLLPLMILFFWGLKPLPPSLIPLHLLAFFFTAMVCHGELAKTRPSTIYLTEFYLWLAVGGVLGGLFNALVAPMVFDTLAEYPLVIGLACLLRPSPNSRGQKPNEIWLDLALPLVLTAILGGLVLFISKPGLGHVLRLDDSGSWLGLMIILFISCFLGFILYLFCERPIRFGLGVGGVILASFLWTSGQNQVLYSERNFFGVLEVVHDAADGYHLLHHGTTIHGAQSLNPTRRGEPLTYYHPTGPVGQVFEMFSNKPNRNRVAIIGLGTGSLACYAAPGQDWTFYEIDPAVARIARDPRYFTFLRDCPAKMDVILGDGRLSLAQAPDSHFDLIVLDVFSSDAIPVHFLTREAINLYLAKLSQGGILLFHISNKYLNLKPVLGDLAAKASLACFVRENRISSLAEEKAKKIGSIWAVMARQPNDLGSLSDDRRWEPLPGRPGARLWSDDFSNVFSVFKWSSAKD
jgi:hypothetical protein